MGLFMTSMFGAMIANKINDIACATSPVRKAYKSLERDGKMVRARNQLASDLEKIDDRDLPDEIDLSLKIEALSRYYSRVGKAVRREEIYAAREAYRHGNLGPSINLAKRYAEIKDLLEEYFW